MTIEELTSCTSSEEIANLMSKYGIKGKPMSPRSCPITNYYKKAMNTDSKYISTGISGNIMDMGPIGKEYLVEGTEAMHMFVRFFDMGDYPNLIKGDRYEFI